MDSKKLTYVYAVSNPALPDSTGTAWRALIANQYGAIYTQLQSGSGAAVSTGAMNIRPPDADIGLDVRATVSAFRMESANALAELSATVVGNLVPDPSGAAGATRALNTNALCYGYNWIDDDGSYVPSDVDEPSSDAKDADSHFAQLAFSYPYLFNGTTWDRSRDASAANVAAQSGIGASLISHPGEWSINHTPAANTVATISRAAVAATRHVCKSISATLIGLAAAAETTVLLNVRDGATGAGTILWSQRLQVIPGAMTGVALSGLNIVGSVNTAMTIEFAAAGGANTFESVAMTGYSAS